MTLHLRSEPVRELSPTPSSTTSQNGRQPRNTVNPPTEDNARPTMLRFYAPEWQVVLKKAKNLYRYWMLTENAYPSMEAGSIEAKEAILEAIAEFRLEGGVIDQGLFFFIIGLVGVY
jgi:hypothetical protein